MASRWMQGMRARQRRFKRQQGNISITKTEERFYRRKILINPKTGQVIRVETIDAHIERMERLAREESARPKEPPRIVARIQQLKSITALSINADERKLIRNKLINDKGEIKLDPQFTIEDVEKSILRYRRLVRIPDETRKAKERQEARRVKREALKGKK